VRRSFFLRLGLVCCGLLLSVPFLNPYHYYPLLTFYSEWLAFAIGLLALAAVAIAQSKNPIPVPAMCFGLVALTVLLLLQVALGRVAYPLLSGLGTLYLIWAALLVMLGAWLNSELGEETVSRTLQWWLALAGTLAAVSGFVQYYRIGLPPGVYVTTVNQMSGTVNQVNNFADYLGCAFVSVAFLHARNALRLWPAVVCALPVGPDPRPAITEGFFEIIKANKEKLGLKTIAIATGDGEATRNGSDGARVNIKKAGLEIVYDKTYPLATTDFSPIVRALQATNADVVLISAYPNDSVGMIRSVNELGLKTKVFGGNLTGPQSTSIKTSLGPGLNGIITFDWWLPAPAMRFPGVMEFLKAYQERAGKEGVVRVFELLEAELHTSMGLVGATSFFGELGVEGEPLAVCIMLQTRAMVIHPVSKPVWRRVHDERSGTSSEALLRDF